MRAGIDICRLAMAERGKSLCGGVRMECRAENELVLCELVVISIGWLWLKGENPFVVGLVWNVALKMSSFYVS